MESQKECLEYLAKGGTLQNQYGTRVYLDKFGGQVIEHNPFAKYKTKKFYRLDSPEYWKAVPTNTIEPPLWPVPLALFLGVAMALYVHLDISEYQQEIDTLKYQVEELSDMYNDVNGELQTYQVKEQDIVSAGATREQAKEILKASEFYQLNPKH